MTPQPITASEMWLGCILVQRSERPEGGAGARRVAEVGVGGGLFPRARGAEPVTDAHACVRSRLLRGPATPVGPLRGARRPRRSRLGFQPRGVPVRPQPEAPSAGPRPLLPASRPRCRQRLSLNSPLRSEGRVLAAHGGRWGPTQPRSVSGRPAGHHGGPEACAAPPGGLIDPEPRGERVPGQNPAPWLEPSLPA